MEKYLGEIYSQPALPPLPKALLPPLELEPPEVEPVVSCPEAVPEKPHPPLTPGDTGTAVAI